MSDLNAWKSQLQQATDALCVVIDSAAWMHPVTRKAAKAAIRAVVSALS